MSSKITRCGRIIVSRTITNTSRRRTTTSWRGQSNITPRAHSWMGRRISRRSRELATRMSATIQTLEPAERPPTTMSSRLDGELLEVSMGPQHPSTHGVFRMNVALEGEIVRKLKPVFGYLHRNHEKIGENTSYLGSMPYTDRLDYFCSMTNNWAYALSVEKLAGIEVPERAEYLRVILAELTRLQNHASLLGFLLSDMGAWGTPLMYAFREREKILDLFESLAGSRMMCDYMRFGGCRVDANDEWLTGAKKIVDRFPTFLDEFEELILQNEIVIARTQNVGKLSRDLAISTGITGPMLRACGVNYDVRKVDCYGFYPRFKFRIPLGEHGDTYDRLMMRILDTGFSPQGWPALVHQASSIKHPASALTMIGTGILKGMAVTARNFVGSY